MNAKTIALGVVVIIGLWFIFSGRTTPAVTAPVMEIATTTAATTTAEQPKTTTVTQPKVTTPTNTTVRKALLPFLSDSQSTKCSYETVNGSTRTSSVLYMSKGILRGEFRTWSGTTASNDIVHYDGTYAYTWKEGMSTGTKNLVKTLSDLPALIPRDLTSGSVVGTSQNNASWDCHQWIAEKAKITLPTYVSFK